MKNFFIFCLFVCYLSPIIAYAKITNKFLLCLAEEELVIHKNHETGPLYHLNQLFLNELMTIGEFKLKDEHIQKICSKKNKFAPSVNFLYFLLVEKKNIFDLSMFTGDDLRSEKGLQLASINNLLERTPHIFIKYLTDLQQLATSFNCLEKEIPELSTFFTQIMYGEEINLDAAVSDNKKMQKIFDGLINFDLILAKCKKESEDQKKLKKEKNKN